MLVSALGNAYMHLLSVLFDCLRLLRLGSTIILVLAEIATPKLKTAEKSSLS